MPPVDIEAHLRTLIGSTIETITGAPNEVVDVRDGDALVRTHRTEGDAQAVPVAELQAAADRLFEEGELRIHPDEVGYRSAFVGAALSTLDGVEVVRRPARLRLSAGASPKRRNPAWDRDELILALDLYLRRGLLDDTDSEVVELSGLLNSLPLGQERGDERFRNPNGVAMKLGNFARLDPAYQGAGLSRGGRGEIEVWARYAENRDELHALADQLRAVAEGREDPPPTQPQEGEVEANEGRILFRRHRVRERDRSLARKKKQEMRERLGTLRCEVCDLDAFSAYGNLGESVIECHHRMPLAHAGTRQTRLSDLALVCRSCHSAIHAGGETRALDDVRALVSD